MRYRVHGSCFVPMEAEVVLEAESPEQALALAHAQFKADPRLLIGSNIADEGAAFDWQPTAELD